MLRNENEKYELVGEVVSIYRRAGSKKWYAYWRLDGHATRKSLGTQHEGKARRLALELESRLLGAAGSERVVPLTIADAIEQYMQYLQGLGRKKNTQNKYRYCFGIVLKIAADLNRQWLHQVDIRFIDEFRNYRSKEAEARTVVADVVTIRQLINFALRRKQLAKDPLLGLKISKPLSKPQPFWTWQQAMAIIELAKEPYRSYYSFLAHTGARAGEAVWLTWDDVDFENGVIHIRAKDGWKPKTGDQRAVPMSAELRELLLKQPRQWRWVFTAKPSAKCPAAGRRISDRRALAHLKTILRKLGLPGHQHTFRHTFISHALTSGVPEAVVRKWVGHVDARIMRTYTHIADQISRQAMHGLFAPATPEATECDRTSA